MGEEITEGRGVLLLRWAGLPVAGAVAVLAVKLLAGWLVTLPWVPFRGPLELVDSVPEPWATVGALAVGLVGGLVLSLVAHGDRLSVTVTPERVQLVGDEYGQSFDRAEVTSVFVDKGHLVLLGRDSGELARRPAELDTTELAAAFTRQGYPWTDGDPYAGAYRRWVPNAEGLPPGAEALLAARAKRLGDQDEARELRGELVKLGVIVRDDKKKQYWRSVT